MLLPILALALAGEGPATASFGDWAAACDNGNRCQAVLMGPGIAPEPVLPMTITREAGPAGELAIEIRPEAARGRVTIRIDGRVVAPAVLFESGIRLAGAEAEGLARAMVNGRALQLDDYRGRRIATASLAGSSAMLRWIDAQQGRAGGITALAARGTRPASAVPRAPALPVVPAIRPPKGPAQLSPALVARLAAIDECDVQDGGHGARLETWRLDARATLVLIPCGAGAYNFNSKAYVVTSGKAEPAKFDVESGSHDLTNAAWDRAAGILSHVWFDRQMGDCGAKVRWAWDGSRFRRVFAAEHHECRRASDWPVTFRAVPQYR